MGRHRSSKQNAQGSHARKSQPKNGKPGIRNDALNNPAGRHEYSMVDVARNTEQRGSWAGAKLRYAPVSFVGSSRPRENSHVESFSENEKKSASEGQNPRPAVEPDAGRRQLIGDLRQETWKSEARRNTTERIFEASRPQSQDDSDTGPIKMSDSADPMFFWDTQGTREVSSATARPKSCHQPLRSASSDQSQSEDEVIIFTGRRGEVRDEPVELADTVSRALSLNTEPPALAKQIPGMPNKGKAPQRHDQFVGMGVDQKDKDTAERLAAEDYLENLLNQTETSGDEIPGELGIDEQSEASSRGAVSKEDETALGCVNVGSGSDSLADETGLRKAAMAMTDEELALRLAKQEELGLGSSEIVLWQDKDLVGVTFDELSASNDESQLAALADAARHFHVKGTKRQRRAENTQLPQLYHEEDVLDAEVYGDYDAFRQYDDCNQPQVSGRRSKLPSFAVSDSELEANMVAAWQNDRLKKAEKRKNRDHQRQRLYADDHRDEHATNIPRQNLGDISLSVLKTEIKGFLESDDNALHMVPMDKRLRKAIHEIGNRLGLRSKSSGKGLSRYPCFYKTSETRPYNGTIVDSLLSRYGFRHSSQRMSMRVQSKADRSMAMGRRGAGGGVLSGVTYRDGETVGGAAPALGSENKGHALLSKMGWTSGMALGSLNNKGSLEPVVHVVKATKAGLG